MSNIAESHSERAAIDHSMTEGLTLSQVNQTEGLCVLSTISHKCHFRGGSLFNGYLYRTTEQQSRDGTHHIQTIAARDFLQIQSYWTL